MASVEQVIQLINELSYDDKLQVSNYLSKVLDNRKLIDETEHANHESGGWKQTRIAVPAETVFE